MGYHRRAGCHGGNPPEHRHQRGLQASHSSPHRTPAAQPRVPIRTMAERTPGTNTANSTHTTTTHTITSSHGDPRHSGGHTSNPTPSSRRDTLQRHLARTTTFQWHTPPGHRHPHQQRRHRLAPPQQRLLGSSGQANLSPRGRHLLCGTTPFTHSQCGTSRTPRQSTRLQPRNPGAFSTPRQPRHLALYHHAGTSPG